MTAGDRTKRAAEGARNLTERVVDAVEGKIHEAASRTDKIKK